MFAFTDYRPLKIEYGHTECLFADKVIKGPVIIYRLGGGGGGSSGDMGTHGIWIKIFFEEQNESSITIIINCFDVGSGDYYGIRSDKSSGHFEPPPPDHC